MKGAIDPRFQRRLKDDPVLLYLLGSTTRARMLVALLEDPDRRLWVQELAREAHCGFGALYRELNQLQRLGLVKHEWLAHVRQLTAEQTHPLYAPLRALVFAARETPPWLDATEELRRFTRSAPQYPDRV